MKNLKCTVFGSSLTGRLAAIVESQCRSRGGIAETHLRNLKDKLWKSKNHSRNQTEKFWKSKNHSRNQTEKFWKSKNHSRNQTDKTRIKTYNYFSDTHRTPYFSLDGRFLGRIGEEESFINPTHCTFIQHDNYFIVSDKRARCIKVLDKQGKLLYKFGKEGDEDGEFYYPGCLSVDRAGHLLVCDSWNHRVLVFKLNGEFVTKFGAPGKGEGMFSFSIATAVAE